MDEFWLPELKRMTTIPDERLMQMLKSQTNAPVPFAIVPYLFLPCEAYGTSVSLMCLIESVQLLAFRYGRNDLQFRFDKRLSRIAHKAGLVANDEHCCSKYYNQPSPVYIGASTIDLARMCESSARPSDSTHAEDDQSPLAEQANGQWADILQSTIYAKHWTILIRDRAYDLMRKKEPKGTRAIELRSFEYKGNVEADAAGIPLAIDEVLDIGLTFMSDDDVKFVYMFEEMLRQDSEDQELHRALNNYHPIGNNCQDLWDSRLLEWIICQCPDQQNMRRPSTVLNRAVQRRRASAVTRRIASFLVLLGKRKWLGLHHLWFTHWFYWWLHLYHEFIKYQALWKFFRTMRNVKPASPAMAIVQDVIIRESKRTVVVEDNVIEEEYSGESDDGNSGEDDTDTESISPAYDHYYDEPPNIGLWLPYVVLALGILDSVVTILPVYSDEWAWLDWIGLFLAHACRQLIGVVERTSKAEEGIRRPCIAKRLKVLRPAADDMGLVAESFSKKNA